MACPLDHTVTLTDENGKQVVYTFKNEAEFKAWLDEGGLELIAKQAQKLNKGDVFNSEKYISKEGKPEEKAAPKAEEKAKEEKATTGVKKAVLLEERAERGLEDVIIEMKRSGGSIFDAGKNMVDENPQYPRELASEVAEKGRTLSPEEIEALKYDRMKIHNAYNNLIEEFEKSKGDKDKIKKIRLRQAVLEEAKINNEIALRNAGYEWAKAGKAMQGLINQDYEALTLITKAEMASKDNEITEEEREQITILSQKIKAAEDKLAAYENERIRAKEDQAFRKEEAKAKKDYAERKKERNVTKEELKAERASIVDDMRKKLAEARKENKSTVIPYAQEWIAIAPDLAKLAKNYMVEGVVNLDDLVDKLKVDLKDILGYDVEERKIRDAVSGYGKPKSSKPKSQLESEFKEIQTQAKLISALEDALEGKVPSGYEKKQRNKPSEIVSDLRKKLGKAMDEAGISAKEGRTPEEKYQTALKAYKTRLANRKIELEAEIKALEEGTYEPKPKKEPLLLDKEGMSLKADVEKLKRKADGIIEEKRLETIHGAQKFGDYINKIRRAALLSRVATLYKLASAASMRQVFTPVEQAIGAGLSYVPGLKKIAEKSDRYGTFSIKAEAEGVKNFVNKKTRQEIKKVAKGEMGELDALYGGKADTAPEMLEFFGHLHQALKTPAKRAEFFRAYQYRMEAAIRRGLDPQDAGVQQEVGAKAYEDANRAIFMQKGGLPDNYRSMVAKLKSPNSSAFNKAVGTIIENLLPIVRVPYNYVAEQSQYIPVIGGVRAGVDITEAFIKGIENLSPDQANSIMRALQKQAVGAAFYLLGYYLKDQIGGYYVENEKRGEKDVKPGHVKLLGVDIPKWLLHTPAFEMLQFGATLARVEEKSKKSKKKEERENAFWNGVLAAEKGVLDHLPFVDEPKRVYSALQKAEKTKAFATEYTKSYVPGGLQELAGYMDQKGKFKVFGGEARPVKTEGFLEEVMAVTPFRRMLKTDNEKKKKK